MRTETVHLMRMTATDASGNDHFLDSFYDNVISEDDSGEVIVTKGSPYMKTEAGLDVIKVADGKFKVVATGLELDLKGPQFVEPIFMAGLFGPPLRKPPPARVRPADQSQVIHGRTFVWKPYLLGEDTKYIFKTAETGWESLAIALEAQFVKLGELLSSSYAEERFRRIYFDFVPDTGQVLGIPCAGDITERNDFPMLLEVNSSFLCELYDELPKSANEAEQEGDDPVWLKAFATNVASFRAALMNALATPPSREVLTRLRTAHPVDCYLQIWDSDTNIEKLDV